MTGSCDTDPSGALALQFRMRPTRFLILSILAALALASAHSAVAATPCWRQVVDDWYRNGRVTGHYPIHCYSEAIANLPEDSKQYSSAPQDIRRDMLLAIRGDASSGGGKGPTTGGTGPTGSSTTGSSPTGSSTTGSSPTGSSPTGFGAAAAGFGSPATGVGTGAQAVGRTAKNTGFLGSFFDTFGPKKASSIPLPLIILAAVALLLLAAGAASFVARRLQGRRVDPPRP